MKRFVFVILIGLLISMIIGIVPLPNDLPYSLYSTQLKKSLSLDDKDHAQSNSGQDNGTIPAPTIPDLHSSTIESELDKANTSGNNTEIHRIGIYDIRIGDSIIHLLEVLGEPARLDKSNYGYDWWIYNQDYSNYVQVGIRDEKIVSIYSNALTWNYDSIYVGLPIDDIQQRYPLETSVSFSYDNAEFLLKTADSYQQRKFLIISNGTAIEIYIDIHNDDTVTAIRFSDLQTLLATGGYSIEWTYHRKSPIFKAELLSVEDQILANHGNEQQILDLTNGIRTRHQLPLLLWDEEVAKVARGHSLDMKDNNYFDHESPTHGSLSDRIRKHAIPYRMIAENIAAGQADAIEAHEAWMDSYGHRINILQPDFQALGTGVLEKHYTQNFLRH